MVNEKRGNENKLLNSDPGYIL